MHVRGIVAALASVGVAWTIGCATTAPTIDTESSLAGPSYSTGRAFQAYASTPGAVANATAESMEDLKMTSIRRGRDGAAFQIEAKTLDKRTVTVTIKPHQDLTRLACRIGWFGDEPLSKALLERIGVRLGTLPPAPIPENPPSAPASNPFITRETVPDPEALRNIAEARYRDSAVP
jgi:hypothetical protein